MNSHQVAATWRTPGKASFHFMTLAPMASLAAHLSVFSAERLWAPRHGGERLGMDGGLYLNPHPTEAESPCCVP